MTDLRIPIAAALVRDLHLRFDDLNSTAGFTPENLRALADDCGAIARRLRYMARLMEEDPEVDLSRIQTNPLRGPSVMLPPLMDEFRFLGDGIGGDPSVEDLERRAEAAYQGDGRMTQALQSRSIFDRIIQWRRR